MNRSVFSHDDIIATSDAVRIKLIQNQQNHWITEIQGKLQWPRRARASIRDPDEKCGLVACATRFYWRV